MHDTLRATDAQKDARIKFNKDARIKLNMFNLMQNEFERTCIN